jgi:hypothetical protein
MDKKNSQSDYGCPIDEIIVHDKNQGYDPEDRRQVE